MTSEETTISSSETSEIDDTQAAPAEAAQPTEAQRLRALIEKAWNTDPDTKLSLFVTYLEDDEEFLLAAKYATIIKAALEFE